mmetsp:Transcript_44474/g.102797  ORF Transcript_44474/g.102797 Transcript_44474/m.102797 type:complete len:213 (-) Transcript_44474:2497-3135(-)
MGRQPERTDTAAPRERRGSATSAARSGQAEWTESSSSVHLLSRGREASAAHTRAPARAAAAAASSDGEGGIAAVGAEPLPACAGPDLACPPDRGAPCGSERRSTAPLPEAALAWVRNSAVLCSSASFLSIEIVFASKTAHSSVAPAAAAVAAAAAASSWSVACTRANHSSHFVAFLSTASAICGVGRRLVSVQSAPPARRSRAFASESACVR